jgi:hypothetical protein
VNPDLVVRDKDGKPYSVRYDEVNAMLLNEFLKEHRKVQELGKGMEVLTAQLKAQAAANSEGERSTGSQQTSAANRPEQSAPQPITQPNLGISRHASPRGGFCFASLAPK